VEGLLLWTKMAVITGQGAMFVALPLLLWERIAAVDDRAWDYAQTLDDP